MKEIPLTGKWGKGKFVLINDADFERVSSYPWYLVIQGYARNSTIGYLHNFILNKTGNKIYCDHIDRNKLNCQKSNLRLVSPRANSFNVSAKGKSKYKGVSKYYNYGHGKRYERSKPWVANCAKIRIGYFEQERWAAMAYDIWAKEWYGEYAYLNF